MRKHWIVVANGSLARFFTRTGVGDPLMLLETMDFPVCQAKHSELESDGMGQGNSDGSSPAAHFEPHSNTHKKPVRQFASELAKRLEEGVVDGEYATFSLITSRPLMSEIQACLNPGVAYRLKWTHDADLSGLDAEMLESHLQESPEVLEPHSVAGMCFPTFLTALTA